MSQVITDPPFADFAVASALSSEQLRARTQSPGYRTPILERVLTLVAIDFVCALVAAVLSFAFWTSLASDHPAMSFGELMAKKWTWFPIVLGVWFGSSWITDLYDAAVSGLNAVVIQRTLMAMGVASTILFSAYFFVPDYIPRVFFLGFVLMVGAFTVPTRAVQHAISDKRLREHRILLVGDYAAATELNILLSRIQRMKMRLIAWTGESDLRKFNIDQSGDGLLRFAVASGVDEIVVSSSSGDAQSDAVFRALVECQSNGIRVSSMAELYRKLSRQIPVKYVDSQWVLSALQDRLLFTRIQLGIKRMFDIAGAIVAFPVFLFVLPFVALAIRSDSPGPLFYRQTRAGRAGRFFQIVKFRTMTVDAESDGKARWSTDNDPRITRVGKFLRRTRIDELPQFINVLKGDMSLVGPRPERPEIECKLDEVLPHYFIRRLVKPGITGWAQVHYKYGNSVEDSLRKLQYDAYYVRYWSVTMDIYVVLRTIGVMIGSRGQ
jgi:exopolysaccharide biosynthesis polyprenyl glycosylphosphotransferase